MAKIVNLVKLLKLKDLGESDKSDECKRLANNSADYQVHGNNIIIGGEADLSLEWQERQDASIERYEAASYNQNEAIPRLFGCFIAIGHQDEDIILDIGCGVEPRVPLYMRDLDPKNFFGLEPLKKLVARDFPCLVGAVAEEIPLKDATVDSLLLATSMDHIEKIDIALKEMLRVLKPDGRILVWTGLYDVEFLAHAKSFYPIVFGGSLARRVVRSLLLPLEFTLFLCRLAERKRRMALGIALDDVHFRYYSRQRITADIEACSLKITRTIVVPGSTSMFIEAQKSSEQYKQN